MRLGHILYFISLHGPYYTIVERNGVRVNVKLFSPGTNTSNAGASATVFAVLLPIVALNQKLDGVMPICPFVFCSAVVCGLNTSFC